MVHSTIVDLRNWLWNTTVITVYTFNYKLGIKLPNATKWKLDILPTKPRLSMNVGWLIHLFSTLPHPPPPHHRPSPQPLSFMLKSSTFFTWIWKTAEVLFGLISKLPIRSMGMESNCLLQENKRKSHLLSMGASRRRLIPHFYKWEQTENAQLHMEQKGHLALVIWF